MDARVKFTLGPAKGRTRVPAHDEFLNSASARSRRSFLALFAGAAAAPMVTSRPARAQAPAMPVVGFLHNATPGEWAPNVDAARNGLKELGYVEGQNVAFEFRFAEGRNERLPALAADLVRRPVALIVTGGPFAPLVAKAATATIPIVFNTGIDPVRLGLVASLNRPGGNVTGVNFLNAATEAKRLGLLHDLVPQATLIAMLRNATRPDAADQVRDVQEAARALGKKILVLDASTASEIDTAFATLARQRADALTVAADPFFTTRREQVIALAARHALPAMYALRALPVAGGLISYAASLTDAYRQVGVYAGRILKGARPADLPVMLPTKFELVINLKTAKALGLTIPPGILAIADEVVE
jgi:putative ABC transport system substrate-binding protein